MNFKKAYYKPSIEEHFIDQVVNLWEGSAPGPPTPSAQQSEPVLKSTPSYQDMPTQTDAFGSSSPNYTNE